MTEESKPEGFSVTDRRSSVNPQETAPTEPVPPEPAPKQGVRTETADKNDPAHQHLNEVTFTMFIMSLYTSAVVSMGETPDPTTGKVENNLAYAKEIIDILGILKTKTQGNLQKEEESLLNGLLYELRMRYLQKTNQIKL